MRYTLFSLFLILFSFSGFAQNTSDEAWESMFNGKDLSKWKPKIRNHVAGDNFANTFRVEDGKIVVRYDGYDKFNERFVPIKPAPPVTRTFIASLVCSN